MAVKQNSSDKITGNGGNTALYIVSSNGSKQAEDDLAQLAEIAFKSSNPLELYTGTGLKSGLAGSLEQDSKLRRIQDAQFPDDIKNVMPVTLPLSNDPAIIARWAPVANKAFNGNNVVLANGRLPEKAGYLSRYCGYWANFWPKLFTGSNNNLASCEAVLLPINAFHNLVIDKKIKNAWQIAALAEKEGVATSVNFDLQADDFSFGDGIKSFFSGFAKGFTAIGNSFFKTAQIRDKNTNWTNINHGGYKRIFGVMATLLLALMCFISFDYNVTWDEPNHNTFSKDVLSYYTSLGEDTTMFDFQKAGHRDYYTNVFYGMGIDVVAAGINSILSPENDYYVRHFLNTISGFLAILFAALIVRLFSGWLPAIVALLAMTCSPSFFGHCFNNPKDIPFAAGYIMGVFYILRLLVEMPNPRHQTKVMLAISIGFSISIRVQGILPILYLGAFMGLYWLMFYLKRQDKKFLHFIKIALTVTIGGYILGILFWPYALRAPLTAPFTALREFEKFAYLTYYELFEGVRIYQKPWYYEPKLIILTAPLAVIAGFFISLLTGWLKKDKLQILMFVFLIFATIAPAAYIIYKQSYVYNGWRHFIFIYPSLVAIAILGWYWLATLVKNSKAQLLVMGLLALTFIKPGIWSIVNHPYQYIYFNEIAGGVEGANGNYELDYWNQSPRAAFAWLVKNKPEILKGDVKVSSNNIQEALKTFVPEGKDVKYAWTREYEWADNDWTYAIWTTRTLSRNQIIGGYWPPKGTIHEIKVDGVTVAAVVQSENKNNDGYMGKKYLKKNNGDSALYFYSRAYAWNPLEEEYARGIADANKLKMNFDSAIMFYKKAIALRDGNYEAYQSLGEVYYTQAMIRDQNNPDKKLTELAFENLALAFSYKKNASAPLIMGEIRLQQNKPEEAKTYFNQFLETYGNEGRGYLGLAKAQLQLNESDSAYMNLQYAIQLQPKNPEPYYLLGTELKKTGNVKEAEQFLNEYLKLSGMPMQ